MIKHEGLEATGSRVLKVFCKGPLFLLFLLMLIIASCKKDDDDGSPVNPAPVEDKGMVFLHLHNFIDDSDIGEVPGIPNTDLNGRTITINFAGMYLSEIEMERQDGMIWKFAGKRVYKSFDQILFELGEIPVGYYNVIRFKVGLDSTTNAGNPSASPDSAMLNKPAMWFGATAQPDGYVFMNLQGAIDTSAGLTGAMAMFNYKIGTNPNYRQVSVTGTNITITKNASEVLHMVADYNMLFNGIQIDQPQNLTITSPGDNSTALATAVINNMLQMFKPE